MSIYEGGKSLLREAANFATWLKLNFNSDVEIGHETKVRGARLSKKCKNWISL